MNRSRHFSSFKDHFDVGSFKVFLDPAVPLLELFAFEIVFPVPDLAFAEELQHGLLHGLVPVGHGFGAVLAKVADVQVVVQGQDL